MEYTLKEGSEQCALVAHALDDKLKQMYNEDDDDMRSPLVKYVLAMLVHKHSEDAIKQDLVDFLEDDAGAFTDWYAHGMKSLLSDKGDLPCSDHLLLNSCGVVTEVYQHESPVLAAPPEAQQPAVQPEAHALLWASSTHKAQARSRLLSRQSPQGGLQTPLIASTLALQATGAHARQSEHL